MIKTATRILSPTAINAYLFCPRKFYLRYIKKLPGRPSIHLIRGQIVHQTLSRFHKNNPGLSRPPSLRQMRSELLSIFDHYWNAAEARIVALGLSTEQRQAYRDDSEDMLMNFSHWYARNDMPSCEAAECKIFSKNLHLMGVIDAVQMSDDDTVLIDYKTSKRARITDDITRQAALYALLYRDRFKVLPYAVWIHFLRELDDPQPIPVDDELLEYALRLIKLVGDRTVSTAENHYPCKCGGYCEKDFLAH